MIKIIKPGNTNKEIACQECNAILSYCKTDIKSTLNTYLNHVIETEYIYCPECSSRITISSKEY